MSSPVALVTGASRGLGAALALALADTHHVVAVARTTGALEELDDRIQAAGGAATLAFTDPSAFFRPAAGLESVPVCAGPTNISLFCLVEPGYLNLARWLAVALLFVVASGWRPRLTGIVHWWISYSFVSSIPLVDGGDQVAAILALLLIPITLTDHRAWHVALSCFLVIRVQVAGIYFHAAVGKLAVEEWADGTAMYYWLLDPLFGVSPWIEPVLVTVLMNPLLLTLMTWGSIMFEIVLFGALFMQPYWRKRLLVPGLLFHFAIAILIGIPSFSLVMFAALTLYLWPVNEHLGLASKAPFLVRRIHTTAMVWIRNRRASSASA